MDWKLFGAVFTTVFLAELGDKTQLATFGAASASDSGRLTVFLGSAAALVACSALAVVAGAAIGKVAPLVWLERLGGLLFVVLGVWTIWKSFGPPEGATGG
jgi:putative Ca2+/H+ antiporter (TMEM165/GDT1 family)